MHRSSPWRLPDRAPLQRPNRECPIHGGFCGGPNRGETNPLRGSGGEGVRQIALILLNIYHMTCACPSPCPCRNVRWRASGAHHVARRAALCGWPSPPENARPARPRACKITQAGLTRALPDRGAVAGVAVALAVGGGCREERPRPWARPGSASTRCRRGSPPTPCSVGRRSFTNCEVGGGGWGRFVGRALTARKTPTVLTTAGVRSSGWRTSCFVGGVLDRRQGLWGGTGYRTVKACAGCWAAGWGRVADHEERPPRRGPGVSGRERCRHDDHDEPQGWPLPDEDEPAAQP